MAGIRQRLVERYRLTGADVPFGDPLPSHRTEMEGWFWRVTEPSTGRAIVALCSVNRHPAGDWSTTAVALHPGASCGRAHSTVPSRPIRRSRYPRARVRRPSPRAPTGWTSASTICISGWSSAIRSRGPRRSPVAASSPRSRTSISTGIRTAWVDGPPVRSNSQGSVGFHRCDAACRAQLGCGFPLRWWWGQAHDFDGADVSVAFSGGLLELGPLRRDVAGVVVRVGPAR